MKYFLIFVLLGMISCKPTQVTVSIINECDDKQIPIYVISCMENIDSINKGDYIRWQKDCLKQAKEIFCKPVKILNVQGKQVKCQDAPDKYKNLCK